MATRKTHEPTVILGLSRFGLSVAESLSAAGVEVLAIDQDPACVAIASSFVTLAVEADISNELALRQLAVGDYQRGLVAVGSAIDISVLATATLLDLGVEEVWAQAVNARHAAILGRIGATRVINPDLEMGRLVAGQMSAT